MILSDYTFYLLVLHLVATLALALYAHREKQMSTARYTWGWRALLVVVLLCLALASRSYPRDLADYTTDALCLGNGDEATRVLLLLWALALVFATMTRRDRARKLTLAQSCRYIAVRYGYALEPLVAFCRRHRYAFFPLQDFENYVQHCEAAENNDGVARKVRSDDLTHYMTTVDEQEAQHAQNETQYSEAQEQSRAAYERGKNALVLQRQATCSMTYEHYQRMKQTLQQYE